MLDVSSVPADQPLRVILGAGERRHTGWIASQRELYDDRTFSAVFARVGFEVERRE